MADAQHPGWRKAPAASAAAIAELARITPTELPAEYLAFLSQSNGGEGELGAEPGWLVMWKAEEVLDLNRQYEVATNAPGFFGFGSNGGGELIAFDTRGAIPYPVVALPFIPMEAAEARLIAPSFGRFERLVGATEAT